MDIKVGRPPKFPVGTETDSALIRVSNRLEQVPEYPADADKPVGPIRGDNPNIGIKYDNLKTIYEVRLSEQDNKVITVKSFDEAKKLMAEVVALKITPLSNLEKGGRYQLRMMAELDKIILPLYLHNVLFFLSLWDFETDWKMIEFRY